MTYADAKAALEEMARDHEGWRVVEVGRQDASAALRVASRCAQLLAPIPRADAFTETGRLLALALEIGGTLRVRPEKDRVFCDVMVVELAGGREGEKG